MMRSDCFILHVSIASRSAFLNTKIRTLEKDNPLFYQLHPHSPFQVCQVLLKIGECPVVKQS